MRKEVRLMTEQIVFNKTYEDRRTHRSGKLLEYNEKYKTYLLESSDGKTFNVTSSQFKINWRLIEEAEVQTEVKPEVEPAEVKTGTTYTGPTEEKKKELNDVYTDAVLIGSKFIDSFMNDAVAIKLVPRKNMFRVRVDRHIVFDVQVMVKYNKFRLWLFEEDFNAQITNSSKQSLSTKQYPYSGNAYTIEYNLIDLADVLEELRTVVLDHLVRIKGGL